MGDNLYIGCCFGMRGSGFRLEHFYRDIIKKGWWCGFPSPFEDIFFLTDANGCLFLKKDGSGHGIFFVHTA